MQKRIKPVEVERETAVFVIFPNGRREAKIDFFDSFELAKARLCSRLKMCIYYAENNVKNYVDELKAAEELTP